MSCQVQAHRKTRVKRTAKMTDLHILLKTCKTQARILKSKFPRNAACSESQKAI